MPGGWLLGVGEDSSRSQGQGSKGGQCTCEKAWKAFVRTWFFEQDKAIVQFCVCVDK